MEYLNKLKDKKLKITPQRVDILNIIEKQGHIDIYSLYEEIKKSQPNISLATIYKNINKLSEKEILQEVKINGLKDVYEIVKSHHHHLKCIKCNNIEDININIPKSLKDNLSKNFNSEKIDITISGICKNCN